MRKLAGPALALALSLTLGLALSLEQAGVIDQIEASASTLTLRDGKQFALAHGLAVDGLKPGTEVVVVYVVVYKAVNRKMVALEVQPAAAKRTGTD